MLSFEYKISKVLPVPASVKHARRCNSQTETIFLPQLDVIQSGNPILDLQRFAPEKESIYSIQEKMHQRLNSSPVQYRFQNVNAN